MSKRFQLEVSHNYLDCFRVSNNELTLLLGGLFTLKPCWEEGECVSLEWPLWVTVPAGCVAVFVPNDTSHFSFDCGTLRGRSRLCLELTCTRACSDAVFPDLRPFGKFLLLPDAGVSVHRRFVEE